MTDEHPVSASEQSPWFVVVERWDMNNNTIPPYVLGPFATEAEAEAAGNSDGGITYSLLTLDAKLEGYQAVDCFWTQVPPTGERIIP